jgi:hypothetical protein
MALWEKGTDLFTFAGKPAPHRCRIECRNCTSHESLCERVCSRSIKKPPSRAIGMAVFLRRLLRCLNLLGGNIAEAQLLAIDVARPPKHSLTFDLNEILIHVHQHDLGLGCNDLWNRQVAL